MTTLADVQRLQVANLAVVDLARADLSRFLAGVSVTGEALRDALIEFMPILVSTYGQVTAAAAAEWYEQIRGKAVGGGFRAALSELDQSAEVVQTVRYAAGNFFTDTPQKGTDFLSGALQRYVLQPSRETITQNVHRDRSRPHFGRVPSGAKTCAYCVLLASRGFTSEAKADAAYHNECKCIPAPTWDGTVEGYSHEGYYDMYSAARDAAPSGDMKEILSQMRQMYPDTLTDGIAAVL